MKIAVKQISKHEALLVQREADALLRLNHPNVIRLYKMVSTGLFGQNGGIMNRNF